MGKVKEEEETEEVVEEATPLPLQYKKRSLLLREDHIEKLDKLSLVISQKAPSNRPLVSSIVEEALDAYFDFISKNINQEKVEVGEPEDVSDEEVEATPTEE